MATMMHEATLAAAIRDEAQYALVGHDVATTVISVLSKRKRAGHSALYATVAALEAALPGYVVTTVKGSIIVYHVKLLPFHHRVEVEMTSDAEGNIDHMDIMVRQLGERLMGRAKAQGLHSLLPKLPDLIDNHQRAKRQLEDAIGAFGPAAHLLPKQPGDMR